MPWAGNNATNLNHPVSFVIDPNSANAKDGDFLAAVKAAQGAATETLEYIHACGVINNTPGADAKMPYEPPLIGAKRHWNEVL